MFSPTSNFIYPDLDTSSNQQKWTRGESDPDGFFTLMDARGKFLTAASPKNTTITGNLHLSSGLQSDLPPCAVAIVIEQCCFDSTPDWLFYYKFLIQLLLVVLK